MPEKEDLTSSKTFALKMPLENGLVSHIFRSNRFPAINKSIQNDSPATGQHRATR